jgi:hypothetical protein
MSERDHDTPPAGSSWMEPLERALSRVSEHSTCPVKSLRTIRTLCSNVACHPEAGLLVTLLFSA